MTSAQIDHAVVGSRIEINGCGDGIDIKTYITCKHCEWITKENVKKIRELQEKYTAAVVELLKQEPDEAKAGDYVPFPL